MTTQKCKSYSRAGPVKLKVGGPKHFYLMYAFRTGLRKSVSGRRDAYLRLVVEQLALAPPASSFNDKTQVGVSPPHVRKPIRNEYNSLLLD